ncbi:MAG TPA: YciK family oxidoreductase [Steroidobacteraceae bacterium]|nr:YciK family oxidoreductase [Steroidobacteraceae bacterium]HQR47985.1 YciK family oxidoreductase [Steroidobacteraceae bacterium]
MSEVDPRAYVPPPGALQDRVILVTGASGGLGSELARTCAVLGARVVLTGRHVKRLETVYDQVRAAGGPRPSIVPLDFERADASHYSALVDAVAAEYGRLDGLAHVAGLLGDRSPIEHYDVVTWMRVMHVNVNAAFILTQALLPLLRVSQDASVVFTTSGVSQRARAYWGAYAVSKFALEGLMQVLADETDTSTHIRVNSVNPGRIRTSMRAKAYPGEDAASVPLPSQALPTYLYLLGPASRGITGRRFDAQ